MFEPQTAAEPTLPGAAFFQPCFVEICLMHVAIGVQAWLLAMKELHKINNYKVGLVRQAVACSTMTGAVAALQHSAEPWTGSPSPRGSLMGHAAWPCCCAPAVVTTGFAAL